MRLTFRSKLVAIVAVGAIALLVLVGASSLIERRVDHELQSIQQRYVPQIGLRSRLERQFERIGRSLQDAAEAGDADLLAEARQHQDALLAEIATAADVIPAAEVAPLRATLEDYYRAAATISSRMIEGETGEDLVGAIEAMQAKQARAAELLDHATRFDEHELGKAFASAAGAQRTGARIRLIASLAALVSILGLSIWIGRDLFRSLADLAAGFRRFGEGRFETPIPVASRDELGDVAQQANQMAARLRELDWLKSGHAGLVEHLHGEREPGEVADRAVAFLARHLELPVAAIYYAGAEGELTLLGSYGVDPAPDAPPPRFRIGQGLVGQAALHPEITVVDTPDADAVRIRTATIEAHPHALVYVPLLHGGKMSGVLELVLLGPWTELAAELVLSVRESLTITIEVARARAATRVLLAKTQSQASELSRASVYKSQFLASMSHELRTPLNAIIGFSELMYDGIVTAEAPQYREFLGHILSSGRHLLQLINDVLDLSKIEAGKLEFHPERLELSRVVGEVLGILRTTVANRRIEVASIVDPAVDELVLDPARLKQVLYNYVSNALKFTSAGGAVTIRATPEGVDAVRLEVEDTGVGIAPEDLGRLFVDFQQIGKDALRTGGTGLGLALTKRLVEAQSGSVGVRSTPGKGSVFHAILPRESDTTRAPAREAAAPAAAGARTVLVVEDDARDQEQLATALHGAGYAVDVVSSGKEALTRARERSFDAITLDLLLPDMSGLDVLRGLRAEGPNQQVPVIVITVVAERGAVAGFAVHDVLPKPLDGELLLASLLRAGVTPSASRVVLVVDDDQAALDLMSTTLHELGYQARCESDAQVALRKLDAAPPNAIVLDLVMPGMSGFEFLDQLRSATETRTVPVIVWTNKDLSAEEHAVLRASADAVVSKGHGGTAGVIAELATRLSTPRTGLP